jgi:predicted nucleic acid binding AN1-type Zn finger protein
MPRCAHTNCSYKLDLVAQSIVCKCKATFCNLHRAPEKHQCKFDYQAAAKERLTSALPAVIAKKLETI